MPGIINLWGPYQTLQCQLTVPWYHCGAHLQCRKPPAQLPSYGPETCSGAPGLWSESWPVPLNSALLLPRQPGTTNITDVRKHKHKHVFFDYKLHEY